MSYCHQDIYTKKPHFRAISIPGPLILGQLRTSQKRIWVGNLVRIYGLGHCSSAYILLKWATKAVTLPLGNYLKLALKDAISLNLTIKIAYFNIVVQKWYWKKVGGFYSLKSPPSGNEPISTTCIRLFPEMFCQWLAKLKSSNCATIQNIAQSDFHIKL